LFERAVAAIKRSKSPIAFPLFMVLIFRRYYTRYYTKTSFRNYFMEN